MLKVGVTGGLATGKSFVASCFEAWGARVVHADRLGHAVLEKDGEAYADTVAEFGPEILRPDGSIDRAALGRIVFSDPARLAALNAIVHPRVFARQEAFFRQVEAEDPQGVAVVEAAIMIESGSYRRYDRLVLTVCPVEEQIRRFVARGGDEAEARRRLARQMSNDEKIPYADYVIDTSGDKEATAEQARAVWEKLKAEAAAGAR